MVALREGTAMPPLFLFTGAGGGVHWFQGIARHLPGRRPVYAMEMLALSEQNKFGSIEDIATEGLAAIRELQPTGPYLLGGFSVGGHIAFEIAHRLRCDGKIVQMLALIDAYGPEIITSRARQVLTYIKKFWRRSPQEKRQFFREKIAWLKFLWQVRNSNRDTREKQSEIDRAMASQVAAAERYAAPPWPDDILLLRSSIPPNRLETDHYCGWRSHIQGKITVHVIPGNHFAMFFTPQDRLIATMLNDYIAAHEVSRRLQS
jgi:thioesterase domain-containing protein